MSLVGTIDIAVKAILFKESSSFLLPVVVGQYAARDHMDVVTEGRLPGVPWALAIVPGPESFIDLL